MNFFVRDFNLIQLLMLSKNGALKGMKSSLDLHDISLWMVLAFHLRFGAKISWIIQRLN